MQILVLGMHRSGTSLTTRLINMMGAHFGPESSTGELTNDNPKGFWERPEVFKLNDTILAHQNCTWRDLRHFNPTTPLPEKTIYPLKKFILGMDAHRPWVLKDPRMCLLLPNWLPYLEAPIAVIATRSPADIIASLHKRDNLPPEYALALWETYMVTMLNASINLPRIHIRYADLIEKPLPTTELLYTQLREHGVRRIEMPSEREIRAFIDPRLQRSHGNISLTQAQHFLIDIVQGNIPQTALLKISDSSKALIKQGLTP